MAFESLFERYDRLIVFDVETTGFDPRREEIIQFAAQTMTPYEVTDYDRLVQLSPGGCLPWRITQLTGIRPQDLAQKGIPKTQLAAELTELLEGNPLLIAYNAQFDLQFLYYFLLRYGDPCILQGKDKLDPLGIFRDRTPGKHTLADAIRYYGVQGRNSHRALDDAAATLGVLAALEQEKPDLDRYINLFGTIGGVEGKPISSVRYRRHQRGIPLYELP